MLGGFQVKVSQPVRKTQGTTVSNKEGKKNAADSLRPPRRINGLTEQTPFLWHSFRTSVCPLSMEREQCALVCNAGGSCAGNKVARGPKTEGKHLSWGVVIPQISQTETKSHLEMKRKGAGNHLSTRKTNDAHCRAFTLWPIFIAPRTLTWHLLLGPSPYFSARIPTFTGFVIIP